MPCSRGRTRLPRRSWPGPLGRARRCGNRARRNPSRPRPLVMSSMYPGTASARSFTSRTRVGTNVAAIPTIRRSAPMNTKPTATPRRLPRRTRNSTAGLSAIARKSAISTQMITERVTHRASSTTAAPRTTPITVRIARGLKRTLRSSSHHPSIGSGLDGPVVTSRDAAPRRHTSRPSGTHRDKLGHGRVHGERASEVGGEPHVQHLASLT